ncbi:MAG TPA: hypothetical protein VM186_13450 [Planctomycetota bacterium]|nr:hypothetical protein [Planctomycetota bacterium]
MESWKMIVVGSIVVLVVCMQATAGEKRPVPDPAKVCVVMEIDKRAPEGLKGRLDDIVNAVGGFQTVPCDDPKNAAREAIQAGAGAILQVELVAGPRQVPDAEYKRPSKPKVKYELLQMTSAGPRKIASGTIVAGGEGDKDSEDSGSIRDELAAVLVSKFVPCKIKSVKKGDDPKVVVAVSNRTGTTVNQVTLAEGETKLSSENVEIKPRETKEVEISVGGARFDLAKARFIAVRFAQGSADDEAKDEEKAEE